MKKTDEYLVTAHYPADDTVDHLWASDLDEVVSHVKDLVESGVPKSQLRVLSVREVPLTVTTITRVTNVLFGRDKEEENEGPLEDTEEVDEMLNDLSEPSPVSASSGSDWHRDSFAGLGATDKPLNQE